MTQLLSNLTGGGTGSASQLLLDALAGGGGPSDATDRITSALNLGQDGGALDLITRLLTNQDTGILQVLNPDELSGTRDQIAQLLTGQTGLADDPRLQALITAATRPILEQFQDADLQNRSLFTQAGQFVQPGSSSPFELASSRLQVGLANALGDTGARLAFDFGEAERNRQFDLISQLQGDVGDREARTVQLLQLLQSGEQLSQDQQIQLLQLLQGGDEFAQVRELDLLNLLTGDEQTQRSTDIRLLELLSGETQVQQDRRLTAAAETVPFERTQLQGLIDTLDANALPRLIEQFGITEGTRLFEAQQQSLLDILQLLITGNQPEIVTIPGSEGSGGVIGPLLTAGATALGGPIGTAAATAILG